MSEAARSRRPDLRFEPPMDRPAAGSPATDPLAELARLVGQDDPFREVFRASPHRGVAAPVRSEPKPLADASARSDGSAREAELRGSFQQIDDHEALQASEHDRDAHDDANRHWDDADQPPTYDPHDYETRPEDAHAVEEQNYYAQSDGSHDEPAPSSYQAPPLTPDLWAEGSAGDTPADPTPFADDGAPVTRAPRRPLAVLVAVLLLTGGGLAATFVARTGTGAAVLGRETPTIMAAAGPNKIKQDDAGANTTPEDVDSALLNRNSPPPSGPTHVVSSQEQPIDLGQLPKAAGSGDPTGEVASNSPFPEPRKVKTVVVRPDGSIVSPGSVIGPGQGLPALAPLPPPDAAVPQTPPPRPTTPKSSSKAVTTPKSTPMTIADAASGVEPSDVGSPAKARQPSSSGVKPPKAKPVEVADASASVTPAATGQGGAYGLQLAAAPSEQEARDLYSRLQKKYSAELGPYRPTIRKADSGDKSIYRLRVGNLSQDQAKQICTQLQASGGSCFVVRN